MRYIFFSLVLAVRIALQVGVLVLCGIAGVGVIHENDVVAYPAAAGAVALLFLTRNHWK